MARSKKSEPEPVAVILGDSLDPATLEPALRALGLPTGPTAADAMVVAALFRQAVAGDGASIRFWLLSRQRDHWSTRSRRSPTQPAVEGDAAADEGPPAEPPLLFGLRLVG